MWRNGGLGRNRRRCVKRPTAAITWRRPTEGMAETAATHIILDPKSPKGARVLYVAGFGTGVWKSTDGGKTLGHEE